MINIEFLYYGKTVCRRCISTDRSVRLTLKGLKEAIKNSEMKIDFKERKLPESKIHLSPSILINGRDVEKMVNKDSRLKSNACSDCCQSTGRSVNCRTFNYRGRSYDYIPKGMIMDAIKIVLKNQ